jgi:GH24 family phage-related lysozyme (muramidase)
MMKLSALGAQFTAKHEGFVSNWYLDPIGVPTIGIGFTMRSASFRKWWVKNKPGVKFARGASMTRQEANEALRYLFDQEYGKAVNTFLGNKKIPQHAFDAAASAVYNLGPGALKWKWAAALKQGNLVRAAELLRKTGTTAGGRTLRGLVRRRAEEADLLAYGTYKAGHKQAPITNPNAKADGVLERGERGAEVSALQTSLTKLGFYAGSIDGIFGVGTEASVLAFQRQHSLVVDGKAGPNTLGRIKDALTQPLLPTEKEIKDTAQSLKEKGSRTIDAAEVQKKLGLWGSIAALVTGLMGTVAEGVEKLTSSPALIALMFVMIIGGVAFYFIKTRSDDIIHARATDHLSGKHVGRQ